MSTHEKLILDWPEGVTSVRYLWHTEAGVETGSQIERRPPAPAPQGWEGPEGSDWHDYVGKYLLFWDVPEKKVVLRFKGGDPPQDSRFQWESEPHLGRWWWRFCRPLTRAESGPLTP